MDDRMLEIGEIKSAYGIKGWVKVFSYSRPIEQIFNYTVWHIGMPGIWRKVALEKGRQRSNCGLIAKLKNVDDRETASSLAGNRIAIEKSQLATLAEGDYYWSELIGLDVFDLTSRSLGKVVNMLETGANDVLVVKNAESELLIPYADPVIVEVSLRAGRILVDWESD